MIRNFGEVKLADAISPPPIIYSAGKVDYRRNLLVENKLKILPAEYRRERFLVTSRFRKL
jgi:hypothetical protein